MTASAAPLTGIIQVDELGALLANKAVLERREKELKAELIALNRPAIEGTLFRATVSEHLRESLDSRAIRNEMGDGWYSQHAKCAVVTTVKVGAKTTP